jgi:hypothetical protein
MNDRRTIQQYVNSFRIYISLDLKPGVGLSCKIHPIQGAGAILEFSLGMGISNLDEYSPESPSVADALKGIPQRSFGGKLEGFNFRGTNIVMEENRIILIKGDDYPETWSSEAARQDVIRVISSTSGDKK